MINLKSLRESAMMAAIDNGRMVIIMVLININNKIIYYNNVQY